MRLLITLLTLLMLISCGNKEQKSRDVSDLQISIHHLSSSEVDGTKAYRPGSISEDVMKKCAKEEDVAKSCSLEELPTIGMGGEKLSIEKVLSRTLVSHQFLGTNFEAALKEINSDLLLELFGSATLVIISDKINPSFYSSKNGAIYLSGNYLWLNLQEKEITTQVRDTRGATTSSVSNRVAKLKFDFFGKNHIQGKSITESSYKDERTIKDLRFDLYKVLIHELTHANDYLPKSAYNEIANRSQPIGELIGERYKKYQLLSDNLLYPSKNQYVVEYMKAENYNEPLSDRLKEMSAIDMADLFALDYSVRSYGHLNPREDLATLIDTLLVLSEMRIEYMQAIVSYPEINFIIPDDYQFPIAWGEKNRILVPGILERAIDAAKKVFTSFDEDKVRQSISTFKHVEVMDEMPLQEFAEGT